MEVSALRYSGGVGLHGRSPLLRLQSDERLVALVRRGNAAAFEALVSRYESRLLAFCRHLLGSREDAEDILQDVMAAAYNAMLADDRPINVRPWLYRIARNRSLNHLRRAHALASDTMDTQLSDHGATTADKVYEREEFRLLVGDIQSLPETQRTALVLREMDALSYEQIAEAMETTVPSVKSLLVRARVSLAEAAEARLLSCEQVRLQLGEVAEGLQRKPSAAVRRHLKTCSRCESFQVHLKDTNRALAAVLPIGPLVLLRKLAFAHLGHSAGSSAAAGSGAAGAAAGGIAASSSAGGMLTAGIGAIATKAAAGLAAAALVTAGAVEVDHASQPSSPKPAATPTRSLRPSAQVPSATKVAEAAPAAAATVAPAAVHRDATRRAKSHSAVERTATETTPASTTTIAAATVPTSSTTTPTTTTPAATTPATSATSTTPTTPTTTTPGPGRSDTTTVPTVLPPPSGDSGTTTTPAGSTTTTGTSTTPTPTDTTTTETTTTPASAPSPAP